MEWSLHRLSMRYDADRRRGRLFSGIEPAKQELPSPMPSPWGTVTPAATAAAAADALDRVAGMIKKAVYRSSGRRVRGEVDKIPPITAVAPDLPLDVLRTEYGHPRRSVVCTPCAPPNALRIRPANAQNEWRASQSERRSE